MQVQEEEEDNEHRRKILNLATMMQYDDDHEESSVTNKLEKDGLINERPKVAPKLQLRTGAREGASDMLHAKEKAE